MKLLLTGPVKDIPKDNQPAFMESYERLTLAGHQVSPVKGELYLDPDLWKTRVRFHLAELIESDGIVLLPGWGRSGISKVLVAAALECGIPCFSYFSHRPSIIEKMAYVRIITRAENIDERLGAVE